MASQYFYVKSGGTATGTGGRYSTQKTGTWASAFTATSEYYDSVEDVFVQATPTFNQYICVSDASSFDAGASGTWVDTNLTMQGANAPLLILSVDDTAIDSYKPATSVQEKYTSLNLTTTGATTSHIAIMGLWLETENGINMDSSLSYNPIFYFIDCTLRCFETGFGGRILTGAASGKINLIDCTLNRGPSNFNSCIAGSNVDMYGGSITTEGSGNAYLVNGPSGPYIFRGVDISTSGLKGCTYQTNSAGNINFQMSHCQLPTSWTNFVGASISHGGDIYTVTNCTDSGTHEYQYYYETSGGTMTDESAAYRDNSAPFRESGDRAGLYLTTYNPCHHQFPFLAPLPTLYAPLSGSTDKIRVYIASFNTLTDADIWIVAHYTDGTNQYQVNEATTGAGWDPDQENTPTTLTTSSETWTGLSGWNFYHIDVDTSGDVGSDCVPSLTLYVTSPGEFIFIDTTVEAVA